MRFFNIDLSLDDTLQLLQLVKTIILKTKIKYIKAKLKAMSLRSKILGLKMLVRII